MNLTASTRECEPPAARATFKRPSEDSGEEPPRLKCHASITALAEDVNRADKFGSTPLHYAAEKGDVETMKKLLESGADARLQNLWGKTPLHCALIWRKEAAAELLAETDRENDIEDKQGMTPLLYAAEKGYVNTIRKLLAGGARVRFQGRWGRTPLHFALYSKKEAAAELLAAADATNDDVDGEEMTPLLCAAENGYVEIIKKLLAGGARVRIQGRWGRTPLHFALYSKIEAAAELLAAVDATNDDVDGDEMTPLLCAAENGYVETVKKLLAGGARVRFQGRGGKTPLHRALDGRKEAAAVVLAEVDSTNNIQDEGGMTPLHYAVKNGFQRIVKKFVQSGINPHVKNRMGFYPLKSAVVIWGGGNITKILLSMYALRGISIDWKELLLVKEDVQFCMAELSRCIAELKRMRRMQVPESSISTFTLVRQHACWAALRFRGKVVRRVLRYDLLRRGFPVYAELIVLKMQLVHERRMSMGRWLAFFSMLSPPLPRACAEITMLCLANRDIMNFIHTAQLNSQERCSIS